MPIIKTIITDNENTEECAYTVEALEAEKLIIKVKADMLKRKTWVKCSNMLPVVIGQTLHYTFTITSGRF